jgi:hypothetical protein
MGRVPFDSTPGNEYVINLALKWFNPNIPGRPTRTASGSGDREGGITIDSA